MKTMLYKIHEHELPLYILNQRRDGMEGDMHEWAVENEQNQREELAKIVIKKKR